MMTKQEAEQMAQETGWFETPRVKLAHGHAGYGWYAYDENVGDGRSRDRGDAGEAGHVAGAASNGQGTSLRRGAGGPASRSGGLRRYAATIMRGDGSLGEIEFLATDMDNAWTAIRHAAAHQGGAAMTVADLGPGEDARR